MGNFAHLTANISIRQHYTHVGEDGIFVDVKY